MVNHELTPESLGAPSANYALATLADSPARILHTSGIGPVSPDGAVPEAIVDQAAAVWATLLALLDEAEMSATDVVSVSTYVVVGDNLSDDLAAAMSARDQALGGHRCASTLVPVPQLASPTWKMEIALVAMAD